MVVGLNIRPNRYLIDPYLDWASEQGIPIHEGFGFDLRAIKPEPWPLFGGGARGALVHLTG